ncbi:type IV pilus assembly protein PilM [Candidatus Shapirobacteria bacterium]|nr:type IV pilus assembly protein PilM [Candidatus Shapirobacteria bacterium]
MSGQIGLDIGVSLTKIACLEKRGEGWKLLGLGETTSPPGGTQLLSAESRLAEAVKKLVADLGIKTRVAISALPEESITSRVLSFPPMKEEEVYKAIFYEAETFVPYPLEEVQVDYQILQQTPDRILAFVVAAQKTIIERYEKIINEANLVPAAIETTATALSRCLPESMEKPAMILDLGARNSTMVVTKNGSIYFTRTVPFGGEAFTRSLSVALGMDNFQAEEYKKAYGFKGGEWEGKIHRALHDVFVRLGEEIKKGLLAFQEEWQDQVGFLMIAGGGASLPGLTEELVKILGIEVQINQPLAGIDLEGAKWLVQSREDLARFAVAVGLAKRKT